MSAISAFGAMFLCLIGVFLVCLAAVWLERKFPGKEFDERQKLSRGRAFRLSNLMGDVYWLAAMVILIQQVDGEKTIEPYLLVAGGIMLQAMIMHAYCVITHSVLPLSKNPVTTILGYLFCGILNLISYRNTLRWGLLSLVGYGASGGIFLMVSFSFFAMALMHLIQLLRREKE